MFQKTTAPIPMTDWFSATNDPLVVGRVVEVKLINEVESKKQRKEVYMTFPAIEHKVGGIQGDISFALLNEEGAPDDFAKWTRRFAKSWAAYKGAQNEVPEGTPLSEFDEVPEHKAKEFALHGLTTVEQLAAMTDAMCESIGTGARKWRTAAQKFLKKRDNAGFGYNQHIR